MEKIILLKHTKTKILSLYSQLNSIYKKIFIYPQYNQKEIPYFKYRKNIYFHVFNFKPSFLSNSIPNTINVTQLTL